MTAPAPPDDDTDADDRKARRWWLLLVLAALALPLAYVYWPSPSATATGRVKVLHGPPAVGVTITVQGPNGPVSKAGRVEADEAFKVQGLPPGSFQLTVQRQAPANKPGQPANKKHVQTPTPGQPHFDAIGVLTDGANELKEIVLKD